MTHREVLGNGEKFNLHCAEIGKVEVTEGCSSKEMTETSCLGFFNGTVSDIYVIYFVLCKDFIEMKHFLSSAESMPKNKK
jgi:hypothetical protein